MPTLLRLLINQQPLRFWRPVSRSSTFSLLTPVVANLVFSVVLVSARLLIQELINNVAKAHGGFSIFCG
jgi:hypothetical protein